MINIFNNNNIDKNKLEMMQEIRNDLMDSLDQTNDFERHAFYATDQTASTTWANLKNVQLGIMGELMGLLMYLDPTQQEYVEKGIKDFNDRLVYTKNGQQRNFNR